MALTDRQLLAYLDYVDIWAPSIPSGTNSDGTKKDSTWTKVGTAVQCKYFSRVEDSKPSETGRSLKSLGIVRDEAFRFDVAQTMLAGYVLKLVTVGHPRVNTFFTVNATAAARLTAGIRTPNFNQVVVKRTKPIAGIT